MASLPQGQPDAITRRLPGLDGFAQARLGAPAKPGARFVTPDGGVSRVLAGDRSVAAVTAWSRVRRDSRLCAVPIGGITPTDASVHALRYPEAYPITYVMHRKRRRDREGRALVGAYMAFLKSEAAAKLFRRTGVLMTRDAVTGTPTPASAPATGGAGPTHDAEGRPITTTRDDAAVREALGGVRLQREHHRLAFDSGGTLFEMLTEPDGQTCARSQGTWEVLAGWRYSEHGGGLIARVRLGLAEPREVAIELPREPAGTGYLDGVPYASDPALSNSCF